MKHNPISDAYNLVLENQLSKIADVKISESEDCENNYSMHDEDAESMVSSSVVRDIISNLKNIIDKLEESIPAAKKNFKEIKMSKNPEDTSWIPGTQ
jgi:hypothetical protein